MMIVLNHARPAHCVGLTFQKVRSFSSFELHKPDNYLFSKEDGRVKELEMDVTCELRIGKRFFETQNVLQCIDCRMFLFPKVFIKLY